ncbi:MAG: orotate phosphoribosyltransferase [Oceanospirillaceae bacterium]|jgi:orotate phosphoribosyltransferase
MPIHSIESAANVADLLLKVEAVKLSPDNPFTWASGWKSPIYCDNRKVLSFPLERGIVMKGLAEAVKAHFPEAESVAGVATGAIAQGIMVAEELNLPYCYVRPKPKEHGLGNQIEGQVEKGSKVVVIEDLISTGGSSLKAVKALREHGCEVIGMVAVFTYGFKTADDNFADANCKLITLSDYDNLIPQAVESGYVSESVLESLKSWRLDPSKWMVAQ